MIPEPLNKVISSPFRLYSRPSSCCKRSKSLTNPPWAADAGFLREPSMDGSCFHGLDSGDRRQHPPSPGIHGGAEDQVTMGTGRRDEAAAHGERDPGSQSQQCHTSRPSAPVSASTCCPMAVDGCAWGWGADWGLRSQLRPVWGGFFLLFCLFFTCGAVTLLGCHVVSGTQHSCFAANKDIHTSTCVCVCIYLYIYAYTHTCISIHACTLWTRPVLSASLIKSGETYLEVFTEKSWPASACYDAM